MIVRPPPTPRRGRPAIAPAPRVGRATADIVGRLSKDKKFSSSGIGDIAGRWTEIVGEKTARMCKPVKLTGRGRDGVLHVAAVGPAALLVEADSQRIVSAVNTYCGRDVARRLAITRASAKPSAASQSAAVRPVAPAPRAGLAPTAKLKLEGELAGIEDPRLKAALMKLGREALQRRTPKRTGEGG